MDNFDTATYFKQLSTAADHVRPIAGTVDIAVILGSGLSHFESCLEDRKVIPFETIPEMPRPTVKGHSGRLIVGSVSGRKLLCFSGRIHPYEGAKWNQLTFYVRLSAMLGCRILLTTNASGGMQEGMIAGCPMAIRDHIAFIRGNPLEDTRDDPRFGPRTLNTINIYSDRLFEHAKAVASEVGIKLFEGTYAWSSGPVYETPSEVAVFMDAGSSAVGMSTIPEVLSAKAMGMEVFGLSCITNLAAGLQGELSHQEVVENAKQAEPNFQKIMVGLISRIDVNQFSKPTISSEAERAKCGKERLADVQPGDESSAVDFLREKIGVDGCNTALLVPGSFPDFFPMLSGAKTVDLFSVPKFPSTSSSGCNGKVSFGQLHGRPLLMIHDLCLESFKSSESIFLALLLRALGINNLGFITFGGVPNEAESQVMAVTDVLDFSRSLQHFPKPDELHVEKMVFNKKFSEGASAVCKTGTFAQFSGPWPTRQESIWALQCGASCCGVTRLLPLYAAAYCGIELFGLSGVTHPSEQTGAGIEVPKSTANAVAEAFSKIWRQGFESSAKTNTMPSLLYPTPPGPVSTSTIVQEAVDSVTALIKKSGHSVEDTKVAVIIDAGMEKFILRHMQKCVKFPFASIKNFATGKEDDGFLAHGVIHRQNVWLLCPPSTIEDGSPDRTTPIRALNQLGVGDYLFLPFGWDCSSKFKPGDLVCVSDHVSLTGLSPLFGPNDDKFGPRFPDMSSVYNKCLVIQSAAQDILKHNIPTARAVAHPSPLFMTPGRLEMGVKVHCELAVCSLIPEITIVHHLKGKASCLAVLRAAGHHLDKEMSSLDGEKVTKLIDAAVAAIAGVN